MTTPLFGRDSIPHKTSSFFGLVGTFVLWLIFILCGIFIRVKPAKQNLKPVQIVLSSTPVIEKEKVFEDSQSSSPRIDENHAENVEVVAETPGEQPVEPVAEVIPEPVAQSVVQEVIAPVIPEVVEQAPKIEPPAPKSEANPEPKPVAPKAEINPANNTKPKTAPAEKPKAKTEKIEKPAEKTATTKPAEPAKKAEPVQEFEAPALVKSTEELMAEQMNAKKKKTAEFDWDAMFGDDDDTPSSSTQTQKKVAADNTNALQGTAGTTSDTKATQRTESTSSNNRSTSESVSSTTSSNLSKILNPTDYSSKSGGSLGTVKAKTISSGSGDVSMEMSDGSIRALLYPSKPTIDLSDEAEKLIDSDKTVNISFTVLSSGNIGEISITPEAILPKLVRDEIRTQLRDWRFEIASNSATAKFEYTIKKQ